MGKLNIMYKRSLQILTVLVSFLALNFNISFSKESQDIEELIEEGTTVSEEKVVQQEETKVEKKKSKGFSLFKTSELVKKQRKEREGLREKQKKERTEEIERKKKEKEELRKKQKEKSESKINIYKKTSGIARENKLLARKAIRDRNEEIWQARMSKRHIEVITNEEDPIYIAKAEVLNSKTEFLQVKDVEFKYKLKVKNQTPKIINSVLIIWERKIPFSEGSTIMRETKTSKPIIPYEERTVEYNELDSKRQGETYRVKIANVIFEDGTQWKNFN